MTQITDANLLINNVDFAAGQARLSRATPPAPAADDAELLRLKKACVDFEALLYNSMLKSMRKTVDKSELFSGGSAESIYTSMLDQEYAAILSKNSRNGVADRLFEQLMQRKISSEKNQDNIGEIKGNKSLVGETYKKFSGGP